MFKHAICMKSTERICTIIIFVVLVFTSYSPVVLSASASSDEYNDPIAFIQSDWEINVTGYGNTYLTFSNYDFDDHTIHANEGSNELFGYDDYGNFYFAFIEDYVYVNDNYINQRGFQIVKINPNGSLEWIKTVSSSYYNCRYDGNYCSILSLKVTGEDQFYFVASTYANQNLEFSSNLSLPVNGYKLIIAYHDSSGWAWAESVNSPNGYAYSNVEHIELDSSNDIVITLREQQSGSYTEFSVIAYSPAGGKWNRQLDLYYGAPTYNNLPLLMDIDGTTIHYYALTKTSIRYDSQSIYCQSNPIPNFNGWCHAWISINSNGVKVASKVIDYTSIEFKKLEVVNTTAYLYGDSNDMIDNSYDQKTILNSTETTYSRQVMLVCSFDSNGTLRYNHTSGYSLGSEWKLSQPVYESDGSAFIFTFQVDNVPISSKFAGINIDNYSSKSIELTIIKIDSNGDYQWHTGIGSNTDDIVDENQLRQSYTSNSGYIAVAAFADQEISYPSGSTADSVSNTHGGLWWFSKLNGTLLDYENRISEVPLASSPEGGLITLSTANNYDVLNYFMPDNDGDNVGTGDNCPDIYNPTQADYDGDFDGDACDLDDDDDGIEDLFDYCQTGELSWESDSLNDHDGDGCKDSTEEDLDDDNDGKSDLNDLCPLGIVGAGNDFDGDGCKDSEDYDDDNDGVNDGSDVCDKGEIDWSSGRVTDHDSDGCRDSSEDADDDNDGITDLADSCPNGATDWPSNLNTDFDADGCQDGFEDDDDDNDGVINTIDDCPNSVGSVDESGCSASQNIDNSNNNGGSNQQTVVYYVCPQGGLVVTDLDDCPEVENETNSINETNEPITQFYYVCPGGSEIVTDMADCPEGLPSTSQNVTYIIDPDSNYSNDFLVCTGGNILVKDIDDCPKMGNADGASTNEQTNSQSDDSTDTIVMIFAGIALIMASAAVMIVILRRPVQADTNFARLESADELFGNQKRNTIDDIKKPPVGLKGQSRDGYEWVEWPPNTNNHWYRVENSTDNWSKYDD